MPCLCLSQLRTKKKFQKRQMYSTHITNLCCSSSTISSELAKNPDQAPEEIQKRLYGHLHRDELDHKQNLPTELSENDIELARKCGSWGSSTPSDTFLKIFHDVLSTIEKDPMCGVVSPPLLGSRGVVPLTIIAPLVDICSHMSNCIARARKEVFLATNYWKHSEATRLITNALKELSRRAEKRGERVVVKMIYDRGSPKQVLDNHLIVPEEEYTQGDVRLPPSHEIPYLDMEVMNYHRPVFGTFHSKYMVVDRELAVISSNNIQENDNLEMMVQLEGPIVDSFYDMCLVSWSKHLKPMLPQLNHPATDSAPPSFSIESHRHLFDSDGNLLNLTGLAPTKSSGTTTEVSSQAPSVTGTESEKTPVNEQPSPNSAGLLPAHTADDPHYDVDIATEVLRSQSVLNAYGDKSHMQLVTKHLNTPKNKDVTGDAPESTPGDEMRTYIPLAQHDMVPMALVCRKPWGAPNHSSVRVPQNAAFIGALRHAKQSVFIQTPDLNAEPLLPEIIAAVKRGINVTYYVCLGYNDAGELLPYQNGHNEMIAHKLYNELSDEEKPLLNIFNYVAKDQTRPIHNSFKQRSCHIKLLIADSHIGIQGNGNQDTQSWFHSQEINVMIDSAAICASWLEGIRRNQNTHIYGAVAKTGPNAGCWLDKDGKQAEGAIGVDPGRFAWAKGIVGAVQRVRGEGGF